MVRCKVKCDVKEVTGAGTEYEEAHIKMSAVYDGSKENKEFFKYTPAGTIEFWATNKAAADQIEQGKEYYVDLTPAE
jgi:hypothetical protein